MRKISLILIILLVCTLCVACGNLNSDVIPDNSENEIEEPIDLGSFGFDNNGPYLEGFPLWGEWHFTEKHYAMDYAMLPFEEARKREGDKVTMLQDVFESGTLSTNNPIYNTEISTYEYLIALGIPEELANELMQDRPYGITLFSVKDAETHERCIFLPTDQEDSILYMSSTDFIYVLERLPIE